MPETTTTEAPREKLTKKAITADARWIGFSEDDGKQVGAAANYSLPLPCPGED